MELDQFDIFLMEVVRWSVAVLVFKNNLKVVDELSDVGVGDVETATKVCAVDKFTREAALDP